MEQKLFEIATINNSFINIDCKDGVFYSQDSVGNMEGFQCNFYEDEPEYESLLKDCREICRIIKHMSSTIDRINRKNN